MTSVITLPTIPLGNFTANRKIKSKFSPKDCSTIKYGLFKGYKDTRRTRCFEAQCRTGFSRNCKFCQHIPYVSSQLTYECISYNNSRNQISRCNTGYNWGEDCLTINYSQLKEKPQKLTQVKLDCLLTEISELNLLDENQKDNHFTNTSYAASWEPAQSYKKQITQNIQRRNRYSTWIQNNDNQIVNITNLESSLSNDSWMARLYEKFNQKRKRHYP